MKRPALVVTVLSTLVIGAGGAILAGAGAARPAPAPALAPARLSEPFTIDNVHSSIVFSIRHNNANDVYGRFNKASGTFLIDPAALDSSMIDVTVDTESIDTNSTGRDKDLRSPTFFSTKEFPTATFKSTKITKTGDNTFEAAGDLEFHGVKKPVAARIDYRGEAAGRGGAAVSGLVATVSIKRSDFGMTKMQGSLGDTVNLVVSLQGGRK